jgi:hypothetical protein
LPRLWGPGVHAQPQLLPLLAAPRSIPPRAGSPLRRPLGEAGPQRQTGAGHGTAAAAGHKHAVSRRAGSVAHNNGNARAANPSSDNAYVRAGVCTVFARFEETVRREAGGRGCSRRPGGGRWGGRAACERLRIRAHLRQRSRSTAEGNRACGTGAAPLREGCPPATRSRAGGCAGSAAGRCVPAGGAQRTRVKCCRCRTPGCPRRSD